MPTTVLSQHFAPSMDRHAIIECGFEFGLLGDQPALAVAGDIRALFGEAEESRRWTRTQLLTRIHVNDRARISALFSIEFAVEFGSFNLRVRHSDGRIRCARASFIREANQTGLVLRLNLQDAKSLWRVRGQSVDSIFTRALLKNMAERIFFKDSNHVFLGASQGFRDFVRRMAGIDQLEGLTSYDFLPEAQADGFHEYAEQVLNSNSEAEWILDITDRERNAAWVEQRNYPVLDALGRVAGIIGFVREISTKTNDENSQTETEKSLRETLEIAGIGDCLLDIRRQTWTGSRFLESLFGLAPGRSRNTEDWAALVHPEDRADLVQTFQQTCQSGEGLDREYRIIRPSDGETRWVHGRTRCELDHEGIPVLMRGTIQDITARKETESELRQSKENLRLFVEHAPAALAMFDREMRYLVVSRRWCELFQVSKEQILGRSHYEMFPGLPEHVREANRRTLAGESLSNTDEQFFTPDGVFQYCRWETLPWFQEDQSVGGMMLFVEDLSRTREMEGRLRLAASVFEHADEGIMVTDLKGEIVEVNNAFTTITGYSRGEVVSKNPRILKSGLHTSEFYQEMWRTISSNGRWRGELWNRKQNGDLFVVNTTITTVYGSNGQPQYYVSLFFDVTPAKEQEHKLEQAASFDALTGLPNRSLLSERLRAAMTACRQSSQLLALVTFDLDSFKTINDLHGREIADNLLILVANRLRQAMREGDTLARIGGDEFAMVLCGVESPESCSSAVHRFIEAVAQSAALRNCILRVTATAGVTFYPQGEEVDADQLLRQADRAMYEAKLAGKGSCRIFDPRTDRTVRGLNEEVGQIRRALRLKQFVLHYQPRVNMATGQVIGVEALLRWQHPERGLLPPGLFLPKIENHEIMLDVGDWILETAIAQCAQWHADGMNLVVSVNLSAIQLGQPDFVEKLRLLLTRHPGVHPSMIEFEILETSALEDLTGVSAVINGCSDLGVVLSLDDFGTGYSSLTYLRRLPATILKIDQSFVRDMLDDPEDLAIVQGVLSLSGAFRRTPVAEGVETAEHGKLLLQLGCQLAQGYGIARPMAAEEIAPWRSQWRPHPSWCDVRPLSPAVWPILIARAEVRSWNESLSAFLRGERFTSPELDEHRCRFGLWLDREKKDPQRSPARFVAVDELHHQAHILSRQVVQTKRNGDQQEAAMLASQTFQVREQMLALLRDIYQG